MVQLLAISIDILRRNVQCFAKPEDHSRANSTRNGRFRALTTVELSSILKAQTNLAAYGAAGCAFFYFSPQDDSAGLKLKQGKGTGN
jgi:hypothetical protein